MNELMLYAFNTFVSVIVIVDPFAMVPIYLSLTERFSPAENRHTRKKATLIALCILVTFALTGNTIFNFFGITMPAFQIAGGFLLLIIGMEQLHANRKQVKQEEESEGLERNDISVFPLATPLLAGPGAISTVVLQGTKAASYLDLVFLVLAIVAALLASNLVLKFAPFFYRIMGQTGLNLITRLMGIILTAIAVQYIINAFIELKIL